MVRRKNRDSARKASALPARRSLPTAPKRSGLSVPASQYAQSLANPFTGPLASIPDFPSVPSRRLRVYSRGFFSTGTANIGFICASPPMASRSDVDSVWYSGSSYAGTSFQTNTATAGVLSGTTNSDYANAEFGAGTLLRGRIVSSGLRIRYSATNLNRGGTVLGLITPNHNLLTTMTFNVADNYECSARFTPSTKWQTVTYCPISQTELLYDIYCGSPNAAVAPFPYMGFIVQSPQPAVPITFQFEFFTVLEVQGINARGLVPSLADPAGFAAVQTAAQMSMMRPHEKSPDQASKSLVEHAHHVAAQTLSGWVDSATKSALKWIESEGASVLTAVASFL